MTIMTRFVRLCKADIHGVMDQLEDKGLVLKQHLRDMEKELERKDGMLKKMVASRDQAQREYEKYGRECEALEQDMALAIEKDKDDIARMLIKKRKPLVCHQDELGRHIETLGREITQFRTCLEEQQRQYEQLQLRSKAYFRAAERQQWEKTMSAVMPASIFQEPSGEEIELELLQRKKAMKGGKKK